MAKTVKIGRGNAEEVQRIDRNQFTMSTSLTCFGCKRFEPDLMQYSSEKSDGYQGREFGRVGAVDIKVDISHERPVLVSILVMV